MSQKALKQRQTAALVHGGRSQGGVEPGAGPTGAGLVDFDSLKSAVLAAIQQGDRADLTGFVAAAMAPLIALLGVEAVALHSEGLVLVETVPTRDLDRDGKPVMRRLVKPNPRARAVVELARLVGADSAQQGTTPKAGRASTPGGELEAHWAWLREAMDATGDPGAGGSTN